MLRASFIFYAPDVFFRDWATAEKSNDGLRGERAVSYTHLKVHPRFHTPYVAIVVQCGLAIILLLLGGSFRQFFSLTIFAEWMFYMIAASTVFVFRRREPNLARPYRVWGYPVVPALFVLVAAALLYYTFTDNLKSSAAGCVAILAGLPVFYFFARRRQAPPK